tara:strand:- start:515 stop:1444 length:930 start_codon:yes stop_codon:yes gene_type:complete
MNKIKIFSPATVSNVACGFDILGFPIESLGDEMTISKSKNIGVRITKVEGYPVPIDSQKNVATVSAEKLIQDLKPNCGFDIEIKKNIIPGSGIGSSGSNSAGSVFGINKLLGDPLTTKQLIKYAMIGEGISSLSEHPDNVAPALLGGLIMVKSVEEENIISLPIPNDLFCFVINPKIEVKTSYSREILPSKIELSSMTKQVANFGALVHALHTSNYDLLRLSLVDNVIEKHRKKLIPSFDKVKNKCIELGALGCSISGSGPSIFAITKGKDDANKIDIEVKKIYKETNIDFSTYVSKISSDGIKIIDSI